MSTPVSNQSVNTSSSLPTTSARRISPPSLSQSDESSSRSENDQQQLVNRQEREMIRELQARDREVRTHEAAHVAAAGPYVVSGPSYTYQTGPDGRSYAIGGKVTLDTSEVPNNPQETLRKAEQVRRAALAPAEPSPQDLRVASQASQLAAQARVEIAVERREEQQAAREGSTADDSAAAATVPAGFYQESPAGEPQLDQFV